MVGRASFPIGSPGFAYVESHALAAIGRVNRNGDEPPVLGVSPNVEIPELCVDFTLGRRPRRKVAHAISASSDGIKNVRVYIDVAAATVGRFATPAPTVAPDDVLVDTEYCVVNYNILDISVVATVGGIYLVMHAKKAPFAVQWCRIMASTMPPNPRAPVGGGPGPVPAPEDDAVAPNGVDPYHIGRGKMYKVNTAIYRFIEAFTRTQVERITANGDDTPILGRVDTNAGDGTEYCVVYNLEAAPRARLTANHLPLVPDNGIGFVRVYVDVLPAKLARIASALPTDAEVQAPLLPGDVKHVVIGRGMLHLEVKESPEVLCIVQYDRAFPRAVTEFNACNVGALANVHDTDAAENHVEAAFAALNGGHDAHVEDVVVDNVALVAVEHEVRDDRRQGDGEAVAHLRVDLDVHAHNALPSICRSIVRCHFDARLPAEHEVEAHLTAVHAHRVARAEKRQLTFAADEAADGVKRMRLRVLVLCGAEHVVVPTGHVVQ